MRAKKKLSSMKKKMESRNNSFKMNESTSMISNEELLIIKSINCKDIATVKEALVFAKTTDLTKTLDKNGHTLLILAAYHNQD
jgi:hypothetical protein